MSRSLHAMHDVTGCRGSVANLPVRAAEVDGDGWRLGWRPSAVASRCGCRCSWAPACSAISRCAPSRRSGSGCRSRSPPSCGVAAAAALRRAARRRHGAGRRGHRLPVGPVRHRARAAARALPTHAAILTGTVRAVEALPEGRRDHARGCAAGRRRAAAPAGCGCGCRRATTQAIGDRRHGAGARAGAAAAPPAYPGAWDLQRDAFYSGLGGSGYALGPVERIAEAPPSGRCALVQRLREDDRAAHHRRSCRARPARSSVTLLTGVTTGIPPGRPRGVPRLRAGASAGGRRAAYRHRHGLGAGVRRASRSRRREHASLHWPTKKLAALAALAAGGGYMVLTGMHVPIVRSFAMACLLHRRGAGRAAARSRCAAWRWRRSC